MKKLYLAILTLLMSVGLSAQEESQETESLLKKLKWNDEMLHIKLDTRVDFRSTLQSGDGDDISFRGQTFKILLTGEIVPGIKYRVRHRLNKPQTPLRENYSDATDQAWLSFDIGKKWTITAGRQSVEFGTFEYDYNPADVYVPTMCFDDLDAYKTGVKVAYRFAGQTMNIQVVNSDAPQFASEKYKNKALSMNLLWEGNLFDGLVKTRWGYGAFQHEKSKFYNWLTAGTQLNVGKFTTELDYYLGNRNMDYGSVISDTLATGSRYVKDQSVSLNLKYDFGKWKPFIKGVWNQRFDKEFDNVAYQNSGIQAVMEYYPFGGLAKDLRFHAMYAYNTTHFKGNYSNFDNVNTHTLLVGTRWLFNIK